MNEQAWYVSSKQGAAAQTLEEECYFENLSADFRRRADMVLVVEGQHELPCHSAFLRLHSKVFDNLLTTDSFDEDDKKHTVPIRMPLHGESLQDALQLLNAVYNSTRLKVDNVGDAEILLKMAHKYDMPGLMEVVKEYLMPPLAPPVEAQPKPVRDVSSALVWLKHCQCYGIEDHIEVCEAEVVRHYMKMAEEHSSDLAMLSNLSLVRIGQTYARSLYTMTHGSLSACMMDAMIP